MALSRVKDSLLSSYRQARNQQQQQPNQQYMQPIAAFQKEYDLVVLIDNVSDIEPDKAKVLLSSLLSEPTHIFGGSEETKKAEELYNNVKCLRISDHN